MPALKSRKLAVLEANIDDMNPEWYEPLTERLFEAGALDVTLIPAIMKKGRPAVILQVLCRPKDREGLLKIIFRESTTLGVRSWTVERFETRRELRRVATRYGEALAKISRNPDGTVLNVSPEYESCKALAEKKMVPLKKVYAAVQGCKV